MPRPRQMHRRVVCEGLWLIILGFFFKMVCADNLAVYVDAHWSEIPANRPVPAWRCGWPDVLRTGSLPTSPVIRTSRAGSRAARLSAADRKHSAPYVAASFKNL